MIALALGLVIIGAVLSLFVSNKQAYRTNQALGEIQDGSRIAFEFMARDIRSAGLTGCGNVSRVANVLRTGPSGTAADWWANWNNAIRGYDGATTDPDLTTGIANTNRVAGTGSLKLIGAEGLTYTISQHNAATAPPTIVLNDAAPNIQAGDVLIVCDPDHAAIFQATGYTSASKTIQYQAGAGTPGNCSTGLGYPTSCVGAGSVYTFGLNSQIARLSPVEWYIGYNPAGGKSLYRTGLSTTTATTTAAPLAQEMVRNVTDMQIQYLEPGNATLENAAAVGSWANVSAVQITLSLQSTDQTSGANARPLVRQLTSTVTLRNRVN